MFQKKRLKGENLYRKKNSVPSNGYLPLNGKSTVNEKSPKLPLDCVV